MSSAVKYPYASGPLLDERNTYFYSEYSGAAFLEAWRKDRGQLRSSGNALKAKPLPLPVPGTPVDTAKLLEAVFFALENDTAEAETMRHWLRLLVKKFEVTKRIHAGYDASFKAVDKERCRNLALYTRLAEVLELAYVREGALPYLNALLKCLDTLCSQKETMPEALTGRLSGLINREYRHVAQLAERQGVNLP